MSSKSHSEVNVVDGYLTGDVEDFQERRTALHRGLRARHTTMIALGGALGSGLLIGTGSALARSGPASIFICYSIVGFVVWIMMTALCETTASFPIPSGFTGHATRFVDPSVGVALGYSYWLKYALSTANQLTSIALVIQYWCPSSKVNPGVWVAVFLVITIVVNYVGIRFFGELEFWLSGLKVIILTGVVLLSLVLACKGNGTTGFGYWRNPGAFTEYLREGSLGRFLAVWNTMGISTFAYLSVEFLGVTAGEAKNPRKSIPGAARLIVYRILFFYIINVFLLGMIVPYNSPLLLFATKQSSSAAASPFVVAIKIARIPVLPGILNGCLLVFVFSASISDLFIASRTLYALAKEGKAPKAFAYTNSRGVPVMSLAVSSLILLLAFMNVSSSSKTVFGYFINTITVFGLIVWACIFMSHIRFVQARRIQGLAPEHLPYKAPLGIPGSIFGFCFCVLIALTKNYSVFVHTAERNFDWRNFITGYIAIPSFFVFLVVDKLWFKTRMVSPATADLKSGLDEISSHEKELMAENEQASNEGKSRLAQLWDPIYAKYFSWFL